MIVGSSHQGLQAREVETGRTILVYPRLAEERTPSQPSRGRLCMCLLQCSTNAKDDRYVHQAKKIDRPCFGTTLLKNQDKYPLSERERAWLLGGITYVPLNIPSDTPREPEDRSAAGGLTTSITLYWWLLAMLAFPEVQVRAQAELDKVVGRTRPPTFADLPSLPYIRAMVKELPRWSPPLPFGIPHATSADDWYKGMFIPKGTIILPNMRVINSDPAVFGSDSALFNPARYLDGEGQLKGSKDGHEDGHASFGHGRRLCPGRFAAEGTLAIDFATLLWALRFERPEGAQGELDVHTLVRVGIGACVFLLLLLWVLPNLSAIVSLCLLSARQSLGFRRLKIY